VITCIYLDLSEIQVLADHGLGLDGREGVHVEKRGFSHRALTAHLAVHGQRTPLAWEEEKEFGVVRDNEVLEKQYATGLTNRDKSSSNDMMASKHVKPGNTVCTPQSIKKKKQKLRATKTHSHRHTSTSQHAHKNHYTLRNIQQQR